MSKSSLLKSNVLETIGFVTVAKGYSLETRTMRGVYVYSSRVSRHAGPAMARLVNMERLGEIFNAAPGAAKWSC